MTKMDNKERAGSGYMVYNKQCPYHGVSEQNEKECKLMEGMII